MMRLLLSLVLLWIVPANAQQLLWMYTPQPVPQPALTFDFRSMSAATAASLLTATRALGNATDLLPTSPAGATYQTFAANTARITPGLGLLIEGTRTNLLLNSATPVASQTVTVANATQYTLWTNGGTVAVSGCATAGPGALLTFTTTTTSCTVTESGSSAYQFEAAAFGSSLIITAGASAQRSADIITVTAPPTIPSPVAYSYFTQSTFFGPLVGAANQTLVQIDDGSNSNRTTNVRLSTNGNSVLIQSGGVASQNSGNVFAPNVPARHAVASAVNYQASAQDGDGAGINAGAFTPFTAFSVFRLGGSFAGNATSCYCYLAVVKQWPTIALTPAQLQQITRWGAGS